MLDSTEHFDIPYTAVCCKQHKEASLEAAQKSMVLLKNNGVLPLKKDALKKVAVLGPNANEDGYAHVHYGPVATESVTVFEGLEEALKGQAEVVYEKGCPHVDSTWPDSEIYGYTPTEEELAGIYKAASLAKGADVAVVVVGDVAVGDVDIGAHLQVKVGETGVVVVAFYMMDVHAVAVADFKQVIALLIPPDALMFLYTERDIANT